MSTEWNSGTINLKPESIVYPTPKNCQVRPTNEENLQGLKSPLGNYVVESSAFSPENPEKPLSDKDKRRKTWVRHYAQKQFMQTAFAKNKKDINFVNSQYSQLITKKFELFEEYQQISQLHFENTEIGRKEIELQKEITTVNKAIVSAEKEIELLSKKARVFNHSAGLCGEKPIPQFVTTRKKETYETGCPGHAEIHTNYASDSKKAHYVYLRKCASTWFCMHCAEQIFRQRRDEIEKAFTWEKQKSMSFVTLTNPHTIKDYFPTLMTRMQKALSDYRSGRAWKEFKERHGFLGEIRTLEVTFSKKAGFHPHYHSVYLWDHELTKKETKEIETFIKKRWHHICKKHGFLTTEKKRRGHKIHGAVIKTGADPVRKEYLSKTEIWELASTTSKTPRRTDSIGSWELQRLATEEKDPYYIDKWSEYMIAMRARIAIWWSQGLKEKVGITDIKDEELVEGEVAEKVMELSAGAMKVISGKRRNCCLLEAVESSLLNNDSFINELRKELDMRLEIDKQVPI